MAVRRNLILLLFGAFVALLAVAIAHGANSAGLTANGTVTAGSTLSVVSNGAAPAFGLTLNGVDQVATYVLAVAAVDARGLATGGGWNLTITSTPFTDGAGHSFPATASTITSVAQVCGTSSTCTLPTNSVANTNLALPAGAGPPAPARFYNAAPATGLGTVNANATVSVAVPANVFAGTYSSTVTVSIVAGP
jgi:hypothetical protein